MTDASYEPKEGDVVVAEWNPIRNVGGQGQQTGKLRHVFGEVQHVTPTRVKVQTLRTSFMGFSKKDTWVPRDSVRQATPKQRARWNRAIKQCNELVRAIRDAYVGEAG